MATRQPNEREFQLLALTARERSGIEIARRYELDTGARIRPGTLYPTMSRLKQEGWVEVRTEVRHGDARLKHYRITGSGVRVLNRARERYHELANFGKSAEECL